MTEDQRERLLFLARELRKIAAPVGPMHSFWDIIFDIEAFIQGQETILIKTAEEWIAYAEKCLAGD